mgnify:FL=1
MIETTTFNKEAIEAGAISGHALATEIADHLSMKGIPFAEAHEISGKCVKYCEAKSKELPDLTEADLKMIDPKLDVELISLLSVERAINSRSSSIGTATSRVKKQISNLNSDNKECQDWISNARRDFSGIMAL